MTLNKAQLIEIPGGPGTDIGAVSQGDNVEITVDGTLNVLPGNVQQIIAGTNVSLNPASGLGNVTVSYSGPFPPGNFQAGTSMPFVQAAAPAGWVRQVAADNAMFRIVNTAGGGTGGSVNFTDVFKSYPFNGTTSLSVSGGGNTNGASLSPNGNIFFNGGVQGSSLGNDQMPSHFNPVNQANKNAQGQASMQDSGGPSISLASGRQSDDDGSSDSHGHGISGFVGFNGRSTSHDHSLSGSSSTGSTNVTGNPVNLSLQYVDSIICVKS
jgi:hypothetical protein